MTEILKVSTQNLPGTQEAQKEQSKTKDVKSTLDRTYATLESSDTPIVSEISHEILSSSTKEANIKSLEEHNFKLDENFDDKESSNSEKVGSTGTVVVSKHKQMLEKLNVTSEDDLSEDVLMDAYDDPDLIDYQKEIGDLLQKKMQEGMEADNKLISELNEVKANESTAEQTKNAQATEVEKVGEQQASALEKNILVFNKDGEVFVPSMAKGPIAGVISCDRDTGVLSASAENLKQYKIGHKLKFTDEMGQKQSIKIRGHEELDAEQSTKMNDYLVQNFRAINFAPVANAKEEQKTSNKETIATNVKMPESRSEGATEKASKPDVNRVNTDKLTRSQVSLEGKSSMQKTAERLEKFEEKLDDLERQINEDVEKHENFVKDAAKHTHSLQIEKSSVKYETLHGESVKLEDKHKEVLHEVQNNIRVPLATRQKIKAVIIQMQSNEKKVYDNGMGLINKEKFTEQILGLKKDLIEVSKEILKENGIQTTKGSNAEGNTEA